MCILLHFSQQIFVHTSCCWHLTLSHNDHGSNAPSFDILIPLVCNAGYHGHFIYPSNVDTRYKSNGCISCVSCVGCPKQKGGQKKSKVAVRSDMNCSKRLGRSVYALGHIQDSTVCIAVSEESCGMLNFGNHLPSRSSKYLGTKTSPLSSRRRRRSRWASSMAVFARVAASMSLASIACVTLCHSRLDS